MLSAEEREGLLAEAGDGRRRELLSAHGGRVHRTLSPGRFLAFASAASEFLVRHASLPRRRPRPGGRYLL